VWQPRAEPIAFFEILTQHNECGPDFETLYAIENFTGGTTTKACVSIPLRLILAVG
jgi:hypothetical protein